MAANSSNGDASTPESGKTELREKTLKQVVGTGGGLAPGEAKLIGEPDKAAAKAPQGPSTRASQRDYRDYLRH